MNREDVEALATAWCERDGASAIVPGDHDAIAGTRALRAWIGELLAGHAVDRDFFHACSVLGRLISIYGGSPTLASATMDGALHALRSVIGSSGHSGDSGGVTPAWLGPAHAALIEGYVSSSIELASKAILRTWEYPRCAVAIGPSTVAIVAGYPEDDRERLSEWAARVAQGVAKSGMRRAMVSGGESAVSMLVEALEWVGVEVLSSPPVSLAPNR